MYTVAILLVRRIWLDNISDLRSVVGSSPGRGQCRNFSNFPKNHHARAVSPPCIHIHPSLNLTQIRGSLRYEGRKQLLGPQLGQSRRHSYLVLKLAGWRLLVVGKNEAAEDFGNGKWVLVFNLGQLVLVFNLQLIIFINNI